MLASATARRRLVWHGALALVCVAVFFNLFAIWFIRQERFIYSWDLATYWEKYDRVVTLFRTDKIKLLWKLQASVAHDDYNDFAAVNLIPFGLAFGTSRLAYILAIVNIYAIPCMVLFTILFVQFSGISLAQGPAAVWLIACTFALFRPFWNPILYGFVDVGGWLFWLLAVLIFARVPVARQKAVHIVATGLLLALLVLFRRWYAYAAVGFLAAMAVELFQRGAPPAGEPRNRRLIVAARIAATALVSLVSLVILAGPITKTMVTTNWADIYSYSRSPSLGQELAGLVLGFGVCYLPLAAVGAVYSVWKPPTRRLAAFLLIQLGVILVLFLRTQDFGWQHLYLLQPAVLMVSLLVMTRLLARVTAGPLRSGLWSAYLLTGLLIFSSGFIPAVSRRIGRTPLLGEAHLPLTRNDLPEVRRLMQAIWVLVKNTDDKVYVLASSQLFSGGIIWTAPMNLGLDRRISKHILDTHDVDKPDGFPFSMFTARYVVVATPIQHHARPCDQQAVFIPARAILDKDSLGGNYRQLPGEFHLDGGVRVWLYERVKSVPQSQVDALVKLWEGPCV